VSEDWCGRGALFQEPKDSGLVLLVDVIIDHEDASAVSDDGDIEDAFVSELFIISKKLV
jgi:hypothetical protein